MASRRTRDSEPDYPLAGLLPERGATMTVPGECTPDGKPICGSVTVPWVPPDLAAELQTPAGSELRGITWTVEPTHPTWAGYGHTHFYLVVPWTAAELPPWPHMLISAPDDHRLIVTWQV